MIDKATAQQLVVDYLYKFPQARRYHYVIMEEYTIEKEYGWIFFYNSRRFLETGDESAALFGNGPIVVENSNGSIHPLGTLNPLEEEIGLYEAERYTKFK